MELFFKSEKLNEDGMVIDFGLVKDICKKIINKFDHSLILDIGDKSCKTLRKNAIIFKSPPTAECMAKYFFDRIKKEINILSKVRVHETDTGWAEYEE